MVRTAGALFAGLLVACATGCDNNSVPASEQSDFTATIEVTDDVGVLGSITLDLRYVGFAGEFVVDDDGVRCEIVAPGAFAVITRRASDRVSVGISSFVGIETPGPLVRCRVRCVAPLRKADIAARLTEALDASGDPLATRPSIEVTEVADATTTTTTSPVPTTTAPVSTTTTLVDE